MLLILDFGSGNSCKNDIMKVQDMIDAVAALGPSQHEIVLKWQLFRKEPPNIPLDHDVFDFAYNYAQEKGLLTTASVFDLYALDFLKLYDVPFVKIACRPDLYYLSRLCSLPTIISVSYGPSITGTQSLMCVSQYPADIDEYAHKFCAIELRTGVSDHTIGWELYHTYHPHILEKHFVLEHDTDNPDSCVAVTPKDLAAIW